MERDVRMNMLGRANHLFDRLSKLGEDLVISGADEDILSLVRQAQEPFVDLITKIDPR